MIYTITLNPAIDKAVVIDNFRVDEVNRISRIQQDPGGKGINVSNMIKQLGGQSVAVLIAGGHTGETLVDMIEAKDMDYKVIPCLGETRINVKVFDPTLKTYTDLNEPGPNIEASDLMAIESFLKGTLSKEDMVVLAGSIPAGVPDDIYKRWIELSNAKGAKVILDASGKALQESVSSGPFMIKPNQEELESYFGIRFETDEQVAIYARKLKEIGPTYVVVSQGEMGCLLIDKDKVAKISPLRVSVKSTVGAGDAMVGAIAKWLSDIWANQEDLTFEKVCRAVSFGAAASSASIEQPGTLMGDIKRVTEMFEQIKVTYL